MTRATLLALAERVEAATGADRELDALVALAKGWRKESARDWFTPPGVNVRHHKTELPCYTASLDAAMSLVPSGWHSRECLWQSREPHWSVHIHHDTGGAENVASGYATTEALATVAASLRAIAGSMTE